MTEFDHERVSALLNIVAQCAGHSGKLGALSNEAMHELLEANAVVHEKATIRRKKADEDAAKKKIEDDKRVADENAKVGAENYKNQPRSIPAQPEPEPDFIGDPEPDDPNIQRPSVFPADSQTAIIADRRL